MSTSAAEFKTPRFLNLSSEGPPVIRVLVPAPAKRQRKRKHSFKSRSDFKLIRQLKPADAAELDKLRDDLQESIERTIRVEHAFIKRLTEHAISSNRIKHIIQTVGEVPFHSDLQRKIVAVGVTDILKSKDVTAKRLALEEEKKAKDAKRKEDHKYCWASDCSQVRDC